ncbi:hypothetical protein EN45_051060 [Penicillium chrysogenum]|uniref:Uncharacterized protein n=1 Tax=Penicillium chrysogenum TaxID=5076 RepID=A0A167RY90_PENCH|nr:hypothetical protein EN45_051060 [Penicillium chrysogenum]
MLKFNFKLFLTLFLLLSTLIYIRDMLTNQMILVICGSSGTREKSRLSGPIAEVDEDPYGYLAIRDACIKCIMGKCAMAGHDVPALPPDKEPLEERMGKLENDFVTLKERTSADVEGVEKHIQSDRSRIKRLEDSHSGLKEDKKALHKRVTTLKETLEHEAKAGLLIGMDVMGPEGFVLDFANAKAIIDSCNQFIFPIALHAKPNHVDRRPVYADHKVTIAPQQAVNLRVRMRSTLPAERDFICASADSLARSGQRMRSAVGRAASKLLPRSPWSSPSSSSRPPVTEAQATVNTVQQSGRVV